MRYIKRKKEGGTPYTALPHTAHGISKKKLNTVTKAEKKRKKITEELPYAHTNIGACRHTLRIYATLTKCPRNLHRSAQGNQELYYGTIKWEYQVLSILNTLVGRSLSPFLVYLETSSFPLISVQVHLRRRKTLLSRQLTASLSCFHTNIFSLSPFSLTSS